MNKELLLELARIWPTAQVEGYIRELETKREDLADIIRDLKSMVKVRNKTKKPESGPRGAA